MMRVSLTELTPAVESSLTSLVGDLPQNVNFAIRGDIVRSFLEANNVVFTTASGDSSRLEHTEIASRGAVTTVRVRCLRPAPGDSPVSLDAPLAPRERGGR